MSTVAVRTRPLAVRFAAAGNKNRVLATALAQALTAAAEAEARRKHHLMRAHRYFAASVRKVARAAAINDTGWATKAHCDSDLVLAGLIVDYHDLLRGYTAPWLVEQHRPIFSDYSGIYSGTPPNTFSARQLDVSQPYDAQLIYNAYDGVAPIVKAAAAALAAKRGGRG